ncbi:MAG: hypothetical protein PHV91_02510 [Bacteroidales bacterium]|nr:hypothetical protein [Bacteroidales bacterium]
MENFITSIMKNSVKASRLVLSLIFLSVSSLLSTTLTAQGDLLITPRRVVFDANRRVAELNLANTGRDSATYNVSFVQYRMTEDGSFEEITEPDPGQFFADKNLRFFPRTVTLAPGEAQTVRMQVINRDRLEAGEYRSHVYFRAVPKEGALGMDEETADSTTLSIRLIPIFGITIPVILRVGESNTQVNISDMSLTKQDDTVNVLSFVFNREGNMSTYGDLRVTHISHSGVSTPVGAVNGVAVYTPNSKRRFSMILQNNKEVNLHSGSLLLEYLSQTDRGPQKLAESSLQLK